MPPAARIKDPHKCPASEGTKSHVGGPVIVGEPSVLIGFSPAARVGDAAKCEGPTDAIAVGEPSVLIGFKPAARLGDQTSHGGVILAGIPSVIIGSTRQARALQTAAKNGTPLCEKCEQPTPPPAKYVCDAVLPTDPVIRAVALTVFGEAAPNGPYEEKVAIADTIYNRTKAPKKLGFKTDVLGVLQMQFRERNKKTGKVTLKYQYKGYKSGRYDQGADSNALVKSDCSMLKDCIRAAEQAAKGQTYKYLYFDQERIAGRLKLGPEHYFHGLPEEELKRLETADAEAARKDALKRAKLKRHGRR